MATERFVHPALARLNNISDELQAINTLIVKNLDKLPNQPDLVDRLIRRCDELLEELHTLRKTDTALPSRGFGRSFNSDPSTNGSGLQA